MKLKLILTIVAFLLIGTLSFLTIHREVKTDTAFSSPTNTEVAENSDDTTVPETPNELTPTEKEKAELVFSKNIFAIGKNEHGQLTKTESKETLSTFSPLNSDITFVKIAAGRGHTVGLTAEGDVYTWGRNNYGQLGYKTTDAEYNPIPHLVLSGAKDVAAASNHTLVLKTDGTVWGFGSNYTAALGDGTNTDRFAPVQAKNLSHISKLFTGYKFTMALDTDGKVFAWGATCAPSEIRVAADLASRITSLNGGYYDASVAKNPNAYNRNEDCINEEVIGIHSRSPIEMTELAGLTKDISIGYGHALILEKDGNVWSFGCNLYGQMGNRTYNNKVANAKPQQIIGLANIASVSAGFRHSLALDTNGVVYAWGMNSRIEDRKLLNSPSPVAVEELKGKDISTIIDGYDISFAQTKKGEVYAWGANSYGLVEKQPERILNPVLLPFPYSITMLTAGVEHALIIKK